MPINNVRETVRPSIRSPRQCRNSNRRNDACNRITANTFCRESRLCLVNDYRTGFNKLDVKWFTIVSIMTVDRIQNKELKADSVDALIIVT